MEKIKKYIATLGLGLILSTTPSFANENKCLNFQEISKELHLNGNLSHISTSLPDCYKSTKFNEANLRLLAGIYGGTVKVKKTNRGYSAEGSYSQFKHPEFLKQVLNDADSNKDKIITNKEINKLESIIFKKYAKIDNTNILKKLDLEKGDESLIYDLNGYKINILDRENLDDMAGIISGDVKRYNLGNDVFRHIGFYNSDKDNSNYLKLILKAADLDKNKIISPTEIENLNSWISSKYAIDASKIKSKPIPDNELITIVGTNSKLKVGETGYYSVADRKGNDSYFIPQYEYRKGGFITSYPLKIINDNDDNAYTTKVKCIGKGEGILTQKFGNENKSVIIKCEK